MQAGVDSLVTLMEKDVGLNGVVWADSAGFHHLH